MFKFKEMRKTNGKEFWLQECNRDGSPIRGKEPIKVIDKDGMIKNFKLVKALIKNPLSVQPVINFSDN